MRRQAHLELRIFPRQSDLTLHWGNAGVSQAEVPSKPAKKNVDVSAAVSLVVPCCAGAT